VSSNACAQLAPSVAWHATSYSRFVAVTIPETPILHGGTSIPDLYEMTPPDVTV